MKKKILILFTIMSLIVMNLNVTLADVIWEPLTGESKGDEASKVVVGIVILLIVAVAVFGFIKYKNKNYNNNNKEAEVTKTKGE